MSPKKDNREPSAGPDVTVNIPHEPKNELDAAAPPVSAPPLLPLEPLPTRPIIIADNPRTPLPPEPKIPIPPLPPTPTPQVASIEEFHERHDRHWSAIFLYVALALLVAILVVFGGRWIYRKTSNHNPSPVKPTPADTNKLPSQPGASSQNSGSTGTNNTPTTSTNTQTVPTNGQLPNNGPGNVIAIFVGTAIVVGGLHFLYGLRRQN